MKSNNVKKLKETAFQPKIIKSPKVNNFCHYYAGIMFLFFAKLKNMIQGYATPRPFLITQFKKAVEYDVHVVDNWLKFLRAYAGEKASLKDKVILELGPGADLGVGLITLLKGAKKYHSLDINNLVKSVPKQFYDELFTYIKKDPGYSKQVVHFLDSQLKSTQNGKNDKLNYICRNNFDLLVFKNESINLIFSQAAFEHFDDVGATISKLSQVVESGAILISVVDLKTHSRWIRDADPLNIYRYNNFIYNIFKFRGFPNRLRPFQYEQILRKYGWTNIKIVPKSTIHKKYLAKVQHTLNKRFRTPINQMECLSIVICATKK